MPVSSAANENAGELAIHLVQPGDGVRVADHVAYVAAINTILHVRLVEQCGGGNQYGANLHQGQHGLPQLLLIAQHQQHAVATFDPQLGEPVGDLVGAGRKFGEREVLL